VRVLVSARVRVFNNSVENPVEKELAGKGNRAKPNGLELFAPFCGIAFLGLGHLGSVALTPLGSRD